MEHRSSMPARCVFQKLTASGLRIFAMALMLVDHLGAVFFPDALWMRMIGRLAFPIFAFQTAEGYFHTRNKRRYALRLLLFALIAEIPFNLMLRGSLSDPLHQNVLFTLLPGLFAIHQIAQIQNDTQGKHLILRSATLALIWLGSNLLLADYGCPGVLTVVAFYLLRGFPGATFFQLLMMVAIHIFSYNGPVVSLFGGAMVFPLQGFAVFALIPIWLYNGEKGSGGKALQFISYAFYPVHMLILWMLSA